MAPVPFPGPAAPPPWLTWPPPRRNILLALAALVVVAAAAILVAAASNGKPGPAGVSVTVPGVTEVMFTGVPGQLTVTGSDRSQVRLTGPLHWSGPHPATLTHHLDPVTGVLWLTSRCGAGSPCTADYRLAVPASTALVLDQPSGHVRLLDLAGPVRLRAASVDISAAGLRSASFAATIRSGHLAAGFAAAPRRLALTLASAQATVRLPATVGYAVRSQVAAGYLHSGLPRATGSTHLMTVRINSGELELLPGKPPQSGT